MPPAPDRDQSWHLVVDPDVDLHDALQRDETRTHELRLLAVIAAGGVLGTEARYAVDSLLTNAPGHFPWATLIVNVSGCLLIGVLMVVLLEVVSPHRFARPFLGVGVLGGYTTYSTFGNDTMQLFRDHHDATAGLYVLASMVLCPLAVLVGIVATRRTALRERAGDDVGAAA